jgi:hypothetical protein
MQTEQTTILPLLEKTDERCFNILRNNYIICYDPAICIIFIGKSKDKGDR